MINLNKTQRQKLLFAFTAHETAIEKLKADDNAYKSWANMRDEAFKNVFGMTMKEMHEATY